MPPPPSLLDRLAERMQTILFPWIFIVFSLYYLPGTVWRLLRAGDFSTLLSWPRFQFAWFSDFWTWAGPQVRMGGEPRVVPLLEGRVQRGQILPASDASHPGVSGVVLDVGPGSGQWVSLFSDRYLSSAAAAAAEEDSSPSPAPASSPSPAKTGRGRVTRVYGVEPNESVHAALRAKVVEAGLSDVYEIVPHGIESLASSGAVPRGSVDCIVTVLCLCSVPDPRANMRELYTYLKPGGRWFVYEHVRQDARHSWAMSAYQAFLNLFWPYFIGGCSLRRDTAEWLREAGPWSEVDLYKPTDEPMVLSMPHVYGVLTK